MRSGSARSLASSAAASACRSARSPAGRLAYSVPAISGCASVSPGPSASSPAARSASAARAASASSSRASAAAWRNGAPGPSTATARASDPAPSGSRASWRSTTRATCSDPNVPSRAAASSSGATASATSWVSSAPSRNGLPPVTAWHAWANPALAAGRRSRTSVSVADRPERPRAHGRLRRAGQQLRQQLGRRRRLARAHRADHADPQLAERARQQRQPAQRRRIGPVDVVDDEHGRAALAEVAGQPDQSAHGGVHRVPRVRRLARLGCERALGQSRRADRQLVPLRAASQRLEELARHAPGGVLLERAAERAQHRRAVRARDPAGGREQRRLADPRRSLDHDHAPGPGSSQREPPAQLAQFGVAVQQHGHHRRPYAAHPVQRQHVRAKIVGAPTMRARSPAATIAATMTDGTGPR